MDLIDRQKAIDYCYALINAENPSDPHDEWNYSQERINQTEVILHHLEFMPSAQPEQKWILCSERLPEEEIDVLVTRTFLGCKDGSRGWNNHIPPKTYVEVAQYFNGEWFALSDEYKVARNRHTDPVAWMPLPEPYKEDEHVNDKS